MRRTAWTLIPWIAAVLVGTGTAMAAQTLFVSPSGNDEWSGSLPAPNAERTDGPLASIGRARDLIRQLKRREGGLKEWGHVQIREGTYYAAT